MLKQSSKRRKVIDYILQKGGGTIDILECGHLIVGYKGEKLRKYRFCFGCKTKKPLCK